MAVTSATPRNRLVGFRVFLPVFVLLGALSVLWALASPILSGPDETAHATKAIAQVHGEITGHTVVGSNYPVVDLPDSYRYNPRIICFAAHPDVTADCGASLGDRPGADSFGTWVSGYNPIYYYLVGWPSLFLGGSVGIMGMRIVSALISAAILAWAFQAALASGRSRWMPAAVLFLASPMITYMAAMINPQGLEISAAAALWIGLLRLFTRQRDVDRNADTVSMSRRQLWVLVTVAAVLLASARSLGPLWLVIIVVVSIVIVGWSTAKDLFTTARSYVPIGIIAAAGIFSIAWTLSTGSLSGQAGATDAPLVGASFLKGAWNTFRETSAYFQQAAGVFGWLDTWLPGSLYTFFYLALGILIIMAATTTGRRGALIMSLVLFVAFVVPILVQGYSVHQTGIIWQGRYGIFLYIGIPVVAGWLLSRSHSPRVDFLSVRITVISAVLLAVFSVMAFFVALHRYMVGAHSPIFSLVHSTGWQPPLGWVALLLLFVVVVAGWTALVIRVAILAARRQDASVEQLRQPLSVNVD
jgi:hypothetical protein